MGALAYLVAGIALVGALVGAYAKVHHDGYEQGVAEITAKWQAANTAAEAQARAKEAKDKQAKEKADAENAQTVAALTADVARLRADAAKRRPTNVPAAPAASSRPDLACFDRAALESALGGFLAEARGLADEGAKATVDLNSAKEWAQR